MNPDKRIIIDDLTARVNASPFLIVVDYTAITVPEFTNLRSALPPPAPSATWPRTISCARP